MYIRYTLINKEGFNYMLKKLCITLICMLCILVYPATSVLADNSATTSTSTESEWTTTEGDRQLIDENGNPMVGWKFINGSWYYLKENGQLHKGWLDLGQYHYYLNNSGVMLTGWQFIDGHWYFFADGGPRMSGWQFINDYWYYLDPKNNDVMVTGLLHLNGHTYYLRTSGEKAPTGSMMSNEYLALNGYLYHFAESGFKDYEKNLNDIVNLAKSFVGNTPYVYGGEFPSGFDCSGLVKYCYGISQRTTYTQQTLGTHRYDVWNAPAGALYFWGSETAPYHVAIALGGGQTVQAMNVNDGIKVIGISSYMPSYYVVIGQ